MEKKKILENVIRVAISIFLLVLLCWLMRGKLEALFRALRSVNIGIFAAGIIFNISLTFICALRLKLLFLVHDIRFTFWEVARLVLMGVFFNNFMPSTVGGDVIKLYYAQKRTKGLIKPFSSIFVDRFLGVTSLIVLAVFSLLFWGGLIKNKLVKLVIFGLFALLLLAVVLISSEKMAKKSASLLKFIGLGKIKDKLKELYFSLIAFRNSKQLLPAFVLALITQFFLAVGVYVIALSLSIKLPLSVFLILIPVIGAVSSLPSLNGLGIREGAFVYFFKDFVEPELALALSILFLGSIIFGSFLGGIIYLFSRDFEERKVAL